MNFRYLPCVYLLCVALLAAQNQHQCLPCHPREVDRFSKSPMGQSVSKPHHDAPGQFSHAPSGSVVRIYQKDGALHHSVTTKGLIADYPISYAIGHGIVGRSYLIELGEHFFQSPASYYTSRSEWGPSPGYEQERLLSFSRSVTGDCLSCHVGSIKQADLVPITCERCHGPSQQHLERPVPGSIVNPSRLTGRVRDSVCEQCHLEGATVILNPRKTWWDFKPGQALESVETAYVYPADADSKPAAVSHAEQLANSACLRGSAGKLWCGTCHNPHGERVDRKADIQRICGSCHPSSQLATTHQADANDCVSCHMPRRQATDIAHAAITDHRILRRPNETEPPSRRKDELTAWHVPEPALVDRNFGLALFNVGKQTRSVADLQKSFALLSHVPGPQNDPAVAAALGYLLLGSGQAGKAVQSFAQATADEPSSCEYWLDLGVAQEAAGNATAAESSLRRSIQNDPYDYRPYQALAEFYSNLDQPARAEAVLAEFQRLVPQNLVFRARNR